MVNASVVVERNGWLEDALRSLKRQLDKAEIKKELSKREGFLSKGQRRKRKSGIARARRRKMDEAYAERR